MCFFVCQHTNTDTFKTSIRNCMFHHHCTVVPSAEILCITQKATWKEKQTSSPKQTTGIRESYDTNFKYSVLNRGKYSSSSYLLTYSMVQSTSWEAKRFAASQEIPCISRNLKVHYRTHKRPPPVSILGQPYPVHILTFHLLEIHPNIIHPSMPRSPQWSPSLRFPQQGFSI